MPFTPDPFSCQSTKDGGAPATEAVGAKNVIATVLHTLFDVSELRLVPGAPREIATNMTGYYPIPGLQG